MGEHTGHDAGQQYWAEATVDDSRIGDGRVQPDVVRVGGVTRRDGILSGTVEFDVTEILTAPASNERTGVGAVELRA